MFRSCKTEKVVVCGTLFDIVFNTQQHYQPWLNLKIRYTITAVSVQKIIRLCSRISERLPCLLKIDIKFSKTVSKITTFSGSVGVNLCVLLLFHQQTFLPLYKRLTYIWSEICLYTLVPMEGYPNLVHESSAQSSVLRLL